MVGRPGYLSTQIRGTRVFFQIVDNAYLLLWRAYLSNLKGGSTMKRNGLCFWQKQQAEQA